MLTVYIVQISLLASRAICLTFQNKIAHQLLFHLVQLASWCILTCAWKYFYCSHNRTLFSLAQKNHWLENTFRGKRNHQKFYLVTSIEHSKRKTFKMWAHFLLFFFSFPYFLTRVSQCSIQNSRTLECCHWPKFDKTFRVYFWWVRNFNC